MGTPELVIMHNTTPGSGAWMGRVAVFLGKICTEDPNAETTGEELVEHLIEAFDLPFEQSRYLLLAGVNEIAVLGTCVARIDIGYENRRNCFVGFLNLKRGHDWRRVFARGHKEVEKFARLHGCAEIRVHVMSQSHARLYRQRKYGGFEPVQLVLSRRIDA